MSLYDDATSLTSVGLNWNAFLSQKLDGNHDGVLAYSFYLPSNPLPNYFYTNNDPSQPLQYYSSDGVTPDIVAGTEDSIKSAQQQLIEYFLSAPSSASFRGSFSDVSKLTFQEEASGGEMFILNAESSASDYAFSYHAVSTVLPDGSIGPSDMNWLETWAGDVFIDNSTSTNTPSGISDSDLLQNHLALGDLAPQVILHELAHTVGLIHPTEASSGSGGTIPVTEDTLKYTIMIENADSSLQQYPGMASSVHASGLQLFDISTLQHIYGRNYSTHDENATTYDLSHGLGTTANPSNPFIYTIWDGGGEEDTINAKSFFHPVEIDLRQGHFSSIGQSGIASTAGNTGAVDFDTFGSNGQVTDDKGNVAIAFHSIIEDAIGTDLSASGNTADVLIGNDWKNKLGGLGGDDLLFGDGEVYDGDHGFNSVTADDPTDTTDSYGDVHDPNRTLPGSPTNPDETDDDYFVPGTGADQAYGGRGNDTFIASANVAGTDLDGDVYDGGGYVGGGYVANRTEANRIAYADDGSDTVNYADVNFGLSANIATSHYITVQKQGGTIQDKLYSVENLLLSSKGDQVNIDFSQGADLQDLNINGGYGDDTFTVKGNGNIAMLEGDSGQLFFTPPPGHAYADQFYENQGSDTLDLTSITDPVKVQLGGGLTEELPGGGTLLVGGDTSHGTVTFSDGSVVNFSGMEEVQLGAGDDTLITGIGPSRTAGTDGLSTHIDMGAGNNTVQLWGNALLKNGTLYTANGTSVTNFQTIDLSAQNVTLFGGVHQNVLQAMELGHEYTASSGNLNWLDYSGLDHSLSFKLSPGSPETVSGGGGMHDTIDDPSRVNIVGTNKGDTYAFNGSHGQVYLGTGDDTVYQQGSGSGGFYYSGGNDVFNSTPNSYFVGPRTAVSIAAPVTISNGTTVDNVSVEFEVTSTVTNYTYVDGQEHQHTSSKEVDVYDIKVTVGGAGASGGEGYFLLKNAKSQIIDYGADGVKGTADDHIDNNTANDYVHIENVGDLDLSVEGTGHLTSFNPNVYPGSLPPARIEDVNVASGEGTSGDDYITGGFGDNAIHGGEGDDYVSGGFGDDTISGGDGNDYLIGGAGNDTINGDDGNDIITGDLGNDTIDGGTGTNVLAGGSGQDTFVIDLGGNNTILDYSRADGDVVKFNFDEAQEGISPVRIGDDLVIAIDTNNLTIKDFFTGYSGNAVGAYKSLLVHFPFEDPELFFDDNGSLVSNPSITDGADNIAGSNSDDTISSLGGDDVIYSLDGNDHIDAGAGNDTIFSGAGDDVIIGGAGNDTIDGGLGNDTLDYSVTTNDLAIVVDIDGDTATGADIDSDTFTNVENVITGTGNDAVTIEAGAVPVNLTYVSGNDVYTLSSAASTGINFKTGVTPAQVAASGFITDSNGHVKEADLSVSGEGTLTLKGEALEGQTLDFSDGSEIVIMTAGIADSQIGTDSDDTFTLSTSYHGYNGLGGTDTMDMSSIVDSMDIVLNDGSGSIYGTTIGGNYLQSVEAVITGQGDDTANISGSGVLTYTGGNDVYTVSGDPANIGIYFSSDIIGTDVTVGNVVTTDGLITSVEFDITDYGTLTLQGSNLTGYAAVLASGDAFNITATGVEQPSTLFGTNGDDIIDPSPGTIKVAALEGNDTIIARDGITSYDGGPGTDTLDASGLAGDVSVYMTSGALTSGSSSASIAGIENVISGAGDDVISGDGQANIINPGSGSNYVDGGAGDDTILASFSPGDDEFEGNYGVDTIDYSDTTQGVTIDLSQEYASGAEIGYDNLFDIENATGGSGNDTFIASNTSGNATFDPGYVVGLLQGGAGDDTYNVDFSVAPPPSYFGGPGYMLQTISDTEGSNTLNIKVADRSDYLGFAIQDSGSLYIDNLINSDTLNNHLLIENWFNGTSYRPFSSITLISPTDTVTETSQELDNLLYSPIVQNDDINANGFLKVSGNVLQDNGHGADIDRLYFNTLNVVPQNLTTVNGGTVNLNADGSFTYIGASGYAGSDSFQYTAIDSFSQLTGVGTVSISNIFDQPNRAPTAVDDVFGAQSGTLVRGNVLANDSDLDGDSITAQLESLTTANGGTVTILPNGEMTYQAAEHFRGDDSFTYTAQDAQGAQSTATVQIQNIFTNEAPVSGTESFTLNDQGAVSGNFLANATDPDGDTITTQDTTFQTVNGGQVTIAVNGDFTYQAAPEYSGNDSFDYTLQDPYGAASTGTASIQSYVAVNQPPVALNDVFDAQNTGTASGNALANDSDPDGDNLSATAATLTTANGGQVTIATNGDVSYQAADGFRGGDSFDYTVNDGNGGSATGTVNIDNIFTNRAPVVTNDTFDAQNTGAASGSVLTNDSDPDGDTLSTTAAPLTTQNGGTVTLQADGSFAYQAADGFRGTDSFDYTVQDAYNGTATGTVTIDNVFTNRAPVATNDAFDAQSTATASGNVLTNDSDPDGDSLSATAQTLTTANGGSVTLMADGSFNYTATHGFSGSDSFDYTVNDGNGGSATGTAMISNIFADLPPVAATDSFIGAQDAVITGNVLADNGSGPDSDPEGDALSVTAQTFSTVQGGQVDIAANGDFSYTPASGYAGTDSFSYTLNDAYGATATGEVDITLQSANHAPVAQDDSFTTTYRQSVYGNVLANDTDSDSNDSLSVVETSVTTQQGVAVALSADGNFAYTPAVDFLGNDSFSYTVTDTHGATSTAMVSLSVAAPDGAIIGTSGDDNLNGSSQPDTILGLAGNDRITGGSNRDLIYGGSGDDDLKGGSGDDYNIYGETGNDTLAGGSGDDALYGGDGNDNLSGGSGSDNLDGGNGADYLDGGSDNDMMFGGAGDDTLEGGSGDDYIDGGSGADAMSGGAGNDTYVVDNPGDTIVAGGGVDTVVSSIDYTLAGDLYNLTLTGDADLSGTGNALDNLLIANDGNDALYGAGGNDTYVFGRGMGQDAIYNGVSSSNTAAGTLSFGTGISSDQLWLDRVDYSGNISATGKNLRIDIMGTTSSMMVMGEFDSGNAYKQLSELALNDSGLTLDGQLANIVQAMASFESDYYAANGVDFDPTAVSSITDPTVLSAVSSDWHS